MNNKVQLQKVLLLISLFAAEQRLLAGEQPKKSSIEQGANLIIQAPECAQVIAMLNAAVADGRKKFDGIGKGSTPAAFVDPSVAPLCHNAWVAIKEKEEGIKVVETGSKDGVMTVTVSVPVMKITVPTKVAGVMGYFSNWNVWPFGK